MNWSFLEHSGFPGSECLYLSPGQGSFQPLSLWINFLSLSLSLRFLETTYIYVGWLGVSHNFTCLHCFLFFFIFAPLSEWIPLSWSSDCWSFLPLDLVCWCSLLNFYFHLLYSSALWFVWYFFIFSFCWRFYMVHTLFSWLQWASLSPLFWIIKQVSHLLSCSFVWNIPFYFFIFHASSFFYALDKRAKFPSLDKIASCWQ